MNTILRTMTTNIKPGKRVMEEADNIWGAIGSTTALPEQDLGVYSKHVQPEHPNSLKANILEAFRVALTGEIAGDITNWGGVFGSILKSTVLSPIDAPTDLISGFAVIARGIGNGNLGIGDMWEAGQYFASSVPVLGAVVDVTKLKKAVDGMKTAGLKVKSLNQGLDNAVTAAKANKGGNILKMDDLLDNVDDLKIVKGWDDIKDLTIKVKDGDKLTELTMADAVKKLKKENSEELKKLLENRIHNFNAGAKNKALLNLDPQTVIDSHDKMMAWNKLKSIEVDVAGTKMSLDRVSSLTDADDLKKAQKAIEEYNKKSGASLDLDKLKNIKKGSSDWKALQNKYKLSDLKIATNVNSGNAKILNWKDYKKELFDSKIKFNEAGQEAAREGVKAWQEYLKKSSGVLTQAGKFTKQTKNTIVDAFSRGWQLA